jgi:two-component system OmpR family response regulator
MRNKEPLRPAPVPAYLSVMSAERQPHIQVVDDDREVRTLLGKFLAQHGFRASLAADGRQMDKALAAGRVDLIVLDVMMPGEDGLSICRRLRREGAMPILMLTASAEETDRIVGLELGADDYMAKPFNPRELVARIRAVLRRSQAAEAPAKGRGHFVFEGWTLDAPKRELHRPDGVLVDLSGGEFDLLLAFVEHPQRVLTRDLLLDLARGRVAGAFDRSIDVQVSRLRRKIETDPANPSLIKTVRTGGYIFTPKVAATGDAP